MVTKAISTLLAAKLESLKLTVTKSNSLKQAASDKQVELECMDREKEAIS